MSTIARTEAQKMVQHLICCTEIAEMARVRRQAVTNWHRLDPSFPKPITHLSRTPVFWKPDVVAWLRLRFYRVTGGR